MNVDSNSPAMPSPPDVTDVAAMVLFVIWSVRRFEIRSTEPEHNPHVPASAFEEWKREALRAYGFASRACVAKVAANLLWYFGARGRLDIGLFMMVGAALFVAWVIAVTVGWFRISNAGKMAQQRGIVIRKRGDPR